jgi:hypothetical protein
MTFIESLRQWKRAAMAEDHDARGNKPDGIDTSNMPGPPDGVSFVRFDGDHTRLHVFGHKALPS